MHTVSNSRGGPRHGQCPQHIFVHEPSVVYVKAHSGKAHGMIFKTPDGKIVLHITIVGFVDNTTVITDGSQYKPIDQLLKRMQQDADLWNQLLWASGSKLELSKCRYHIVYYDFSEKGDPKMQALTSKEICSPDATDEPVPKQAKNIFKPRKIWVHFKSPGGNSKAQLAAITKKAIEISKAISKTKATRDETRILYESVYWPAIEYTLHLKELS